MRQRTAGEADVSVLSEDEAEAFVKEALSVNARTGKFQYSAGAYGVLLLYTGMRCGEMLALRWEDVDFEHGLLKIEKSRSMAKNRDGEEAENGKKYVVVEGTTKNEKARIIALTEDALKLLKALKDKDSHQDGSGLIVRTRSGWWMARRSK